MWLSLRVVFTQGTQALPALHYGPCHRLPWSSYMCLLLPLSQALLKGRSNLKPLYLPGGLPEQAAQSSPAIHVWEVVSEEQSSWVCLDTHGP